MKTRANRIEGLFSEFKKKGDKALIAFITAGDPDINSTKKIVSSLCKGGADIIELGIPFSDPMADGPTIQASSERAIKSGTTIADVLTLVKEIRKERNSVPIVLFGYYNPIFVYGLKRFAKDAKTSGADGVLIVDLPPEESGELKKELEKEGIDLIYLLTPTSDEKRIRLVAGKASGFIYYVSVAGVTGARRELSKTIAASIRKIRRFTELPIGVGFGISTPAQARSVSKFSDAAVVGSAIVNIIAETGGSKALPQKVESFARGLKKAMR